MLFPFEQKIKLSIEQHALASPDTKLLVAGSGGVDSMCLITVLSRLGYRIAVAHINYQLRGESSMEDETFITSWCMDHKIEHFINRVDTRSIALEQKRGIQEVARTIRYEWLEQICLANEMNTIATGHHMDDQAETVLLKLIRGTGFEGMSAIHPKRVLKTNNKTNKRITLIRPLLEVDKNEILAYQSLMSIPFREDSSNIKSEYTRNKIRHNILPHLNEIQANASAHIAEYATHVRSILPYYQAWIESFKKEHIIQHQNFLQIKLDHTITSSLIYLLLEEYGFNADQAKQLHQSIVNKHFGTVFYSKGYKLIMGHELCDLIKIDSNETTFYSIEALPFHINHLGQNIYINQTAHLEIKSDDYKVLDADHLEWPLILRTWRAGDKMSPLGMHNKKKKIQDILTDQKISGITKSQALVLLSNDEIIWLWPCNTISENYRITELTKLGLQISIKSSKSIE